MESGSATAGAGELQYMTVDAGPTLGVWLVVLPAVTYFMGLHTSQVMVYFRRYHTDRWPLKSLVLVVILLSVFQWFMVMYTDWIWMVKTFGVWTFVPVLCSSDSEQCQEHNHGFEANGPNLITWNVYLQPIVSQIINCSAQLFFVHRCYVLYGKSRWLIYALLAGMISTLPLCVLISANMTRPNNAALTRLFTIATLSINVAVDSTIVILMTWKLSQLKNKSNHKTFRMVNKLVAITWQTALPPAILAVVNIAVYVTLADKIILFTLLVIVIPRFYTFSLLYNLNSRKVIRNILYLPTERSLVNYVEGLSDQTDPDHCFAVLSGRVHDKTLPPMAFRPVVMNDEKTGSMTAVGSATETTMMTCAQDEELEVASHKYEWKNIKVVKD